MKYPFCAFCLVAALFFVFIPSLFANSPLFLNRIEGQIYDENRLQLGDMYVELQNDVGSPLSTQRSSALGRFTFTGLSNGNFKIRILSSGKNVLEQTKELEFRPSITGRSDDVQYIDFYLRFDRRQVVDSNQGPPDTIFAQDIPDSARKRFKDAADLLEVRDEKGLIELEAIVELSPDYFDALSRLGKEYLIRKRYERAYPYLLRAIDVNPRSYASYYALAYCFYQLSQLPAALKAIDACTVLRPDSVEAYVLYGTLLRLSNCPTEAETMLKKAIFLAKTPNAEAHWQLALLLNKGGRNKEAADELETFLKINPDASDRKSIEALIAKLRKVN